MKMCLGTNFRPKNPRRRVQMAPEHGSAFGIQVPIRHFWSVEWHFKSAELPSCGLWPNGLQVTITGCVRIQTLIICTYFLGSSGLYKQRLNLIIQDFFSMLQEAYVLGFKLLIFSDPLSKCCYLNQGFQVSKRIEQISLNPKTSPQEQTKKDLHLYKMQI